MKILQLCLAGALLAAGSAWANGIVIHLNPSIVLSSPGAFLSFNATITSLDYLEIDLNNIDVNLPGLFTVDVTPFLLGPPTVDPLATTVSFTLFTVAIADPYTDAFGPVTGTLTIKGGTESGGFYDPTTNDPLGQVEFTVNVVAPDPSTGVAPEPSTAWMLLPALGLVWSKRGRLRWVR